MASIAQPLFAARIKSGSSLSRLAELRQGEPLTHCTVHQTQATRLGTTDAPESPGNVPPRHDRVHLAGQADPAQHPKGSHKRAAVAQYRRLLPVG